MKYLGEPVEKAAKHCVEELRHDGGVGGVIALDNQGHCEYPDMYLLAGSHIRPQLPSP